MPVVFGPYDRQRIVEPWSLRRDFEIAMRWPKSKVVFALCGALTLMCAWAVTAFAVEVAEQFSRAPSVLHYSACAGDILAQTLPISWHMGSLNPLPPPRGRAFRDYRFDHGLLHSGLDDLVSVIRGDQIPDPLDDLRTLRDRLNGSPILVKSITISALHFVHCAVLIHLLPCHALRRWRSGFGRFQPKMLAMFLLLCTPILVAACFLYRPLAWVWITALLSSGGQAMVHEAMAIPSAALVASAAYLCALLFIMRLSVVQRLRVQAPGQPALANCMFCGYPVAGIDRCPECGHASTEAVSARQCLTPWGRRLHHAGLGWIPAVVWLLLLGLLLTLPIVSALLYVSFRWAIGLV